MDGVGDAAAAGWGVEPGGVVGRAAGVLRHVRAAPRGRGEHHAEGADATERPAQHSALVRGDVAAGKRGRVGGGVGARFAENVLLSEDSTYSGLTYNENGCLHHTDFDFLQG